MTYTVRFHLVIWNIDRSKVIHMDRYDILDFVPQIGIQMDFGDDNPLPLNLMVKNVSWSKPNTFYVDFEEQQYFRDDWDRVLEHYRIVRTNMTYVKDKVHFHTQWKVFNSQ